MKISVWRLLAVTGLAMASPVRAAPVPDAIPIALLVDLSSGQTLYSREPDRRFVPASITKVMTVFTAFELMQSGELAAEQRLGFSEQAAEDWYRTGSTMFMEPGGDASVEDLLMAITTVSANDGSIVLAEGAAGSVENWLSLMNENAQSLGMRQSHFGTPNGWPDRAKTFTTARDLVKLGEALVTMHPQQYAQYFGHRDLRTNGIAQDNHEPITGRVAGADGIKTGFTNQAGFGFLGSAERDGRRLMMVLAGAPSETLRDSTARSLIEWGFTGLDLIEFYEVGEEVGTARVQDGEVAEVTLEAERAIRVAVPRDHRGEVHLAIRYEGPLRAPIMRGERVAQLQISIDGMEPMLVPLAAATNVAKAGSFQRIANALRALFA